MIHKAKSVSRKSSLSYYPKGLAPPNTYLEVPSLTHSGPSPSTAAAAFVEALANVAKGGRRGRGRGRHGRGRQHRNRRSRDSIASYENLMKKKESRLTRIAISIVWLFIFCHSWKLVPTIYELVYSEVRERAMNNANLPDRNIRT